MADNPQDKAQIITMATVNNSSPANGQVWFDGTDLRVNIGGTSYYLTHAPTVGSQYTVSNVSTNRTFNASTATNTTLINTLGTLLLDLQSAKL